MRFDKLTIKVQEAFQDAQAIASRLQHSNIDVEHIILALLEQEGVTRPILEKLSVDPSAVAHEIEQELERAPKVQGAASYGSSMTGRLQQLFNSAFSEADTLRDEFVS